MNIAEQLKELGICVLVPTYNNEQTLSQVLSDLCAITSDIIVVNDGSTDRTAEILSEYTDIHIAAYKINKGKGYALRMGFKEALKKGYRYAITIDSDGQHRVSDIPTFIELIEKQPDSLIIGSRQMNQENIPGKSSFGNNFSSFWFGVNTGLKLPDTQSGYRLYPIQKMEKINWWTNRFEFEVEVLVKSAWEGISVISAPIDVYYPPADERVSHFRTVRDFTRISVLNTIFVLMAILYYRPIGFLRNIKNKSFKEVIKEYIFDAEDSNKKITLSVLLGSFVGLTPLIGYHILLTLFLSAFLKLNKAIALIAVNISMPPLLPLVMYAGYQVGGWFVESPVPLSFNAEFNLTMLKDNFIQYVVGSMVMAVVGSIVLSVVTYVLLKVYRPKVI